MNWDTDAADLFCTLVIADTMREGAKVHAETVARRAGHYRVTLDDMETTRRAYYGRSSEEMRLTELRKQPGWNEAEARQRMERAAREVLKKDAELFIVNACRAEPGQRNIDPQEMKPEIEGRLRELDVTRIIADKASLKRPISLHHRFVVAISGCAAGCSTPEARSFGLSGRTKPSINENECSECYRCVDGCRMNALILRHGRPEIDWGACDFCGNCIRICPKKVFDVTRVGYRVFAGGRLGRFHQPGLVLFKLTDKDMAMKALTATVELLREEGKGEEHIGDIIARLGPAPLYQRIYQKT